jgi:hypothetical protein
LYTTGSKTVLKKVAKKLGIATIGVRIEKVEL